jgi:hypothetical protein
MRKIALVVGGGYGNTALRVLAYVLDLLHEPSPSRIAHAAPSNPGPGARDPRSSTMYVYRSDGTLPPSVVIIPHTHDPAETLPFTVWYAWERLRFMCSLREIVHLRFSGAMRQSYRVRAGSRGKHS